MAPKNAEEIVYQTVENGELEIDAEGRIWRIAARRGNRWSGGTYLSPCARRRAEHDTGSYLAIRAMYKGERTNALAHRLVWRHFHGPIPEGLTVNHKNGQKQDNRPSNLELATYSEQALHAMDVLGHHHWMRNQAGEANHQSKLTGEAIAEIMRLRPRIVKEMKTRHGHMIRDLAQKYGVSYQCIWDVVRNRRWGSLGA